MILQQMKEDIQEAKECGETFILVVVPLMFESGADALVEEVWCVSPGEEMQIQRLMQRDGIFKDAAVLRLSAQMSDRQRRERSDEVIHNGGTFQQLEGALDRLLQIKGLGDNQ